MARLQTVFDLKANSAKFRDGFDKASRAASSFERRFNRSARSVSRAGKTAFGGLTRQVGQLAALATGGGLAVLAADTQRLAVNIGKAARAADVDATSLQTLAGALGKIVDVDFDQVADGLKDFNENLGDAVDGTGSFVEDFAKIGVTATNSRAALDQAITGLAGIENAALRSQLAGRVFGGEFGPKLAAALGEGEGAVNRLREAFRANGGVISDEAIRQATEFDARMKDLKARLNAETARVVLENADAIVELAEGFGAVAARAVQAAAGLRNFIADLQNVTGDNRARIDDRLGELIEKEAQLQARVARMSDSRNLGSILGINDEAIARATAQLREVSDEIDALIARRNRLVTTQDLPSFGWVGQLGRGMGGEGGSGDTLGRPGDGPDAVGRAAERARGPIQGMAADIYHARERERELFEQAVKNDEARKRRREDQRRAMQRVAEQAEQNRLATARYLLDGVRQAESFGDALRSIGQRLAELVANAAWDALARQVASAFGSREGGGGGGGGGIGAFIANVGAQVFGGGGGAAPQGRTMTAPTEAITKAKAKGAGREGMIVNFNAPGASKSEVAALREEVGYLRENFPVLVEGAVARASRDGAL